MTKHVFFPITLCTLLLAQTALAQGANYFAGLGAGKKNTLGSYNSFVGYTAGYENTTGSFNSFLGNNAGYSNTTGSNNSFIGTAAGGENTTGTRNSFLGAWAGAYNTTGSYNSFIGFEAGERNTTGSNNSFIGAYAGGENTTGFNNSFLGKDAGYLNTTGANNSFLGSYAGNRNTSGYNNSFVGNQAGYYNTTGYNNSFLGKDAGYLNTTGSFNSFLGTNAGYSNTTGNNNSFVGNFAGVGNTTGSFNSFVGREAGQSNTTGSSNAFFGYLAGYSNRIGTDNVFVGRSAGYYNAGSGNIFIGYLASNPTSAANITNAGAIGRRASVTISNAISIGSISGINGATAYTNIGIGTTAPAYRLHVNGMAGKPGGGSWIAASDKRLKHDIKQFTDGLEVLEQISPVRYRYNGKAGMPQEQEYIGVIAQEIQQVAPYMIGKFTYQDSTGKQEEYLDYDATALTYILVNAVKAQQQQLAEKDVQIAQIQQELAQIKELLLKQLPAASNSEARLWQNTPNPYNQTTVIKYQLPSAAMSASIKVYSATGQELQSFDITGKTSGEVTLSANTLAAGTYVYKLFIDGQSIDSKKLVLVR